MAVESLDALQLRDSVLAIVAHDIRSPLATITMVASLLEEEHLSQFQRMHFIEMIRKASGQIDKLIHDLLDIARIEHGELGLEQIPTPVGPILQDVVDAYAQPARERGIRLEVDIPDLNVMVDVDRDRILELLGNLVSNALKFTPKGGRVRIDYSSDKHAVTLAVSDTGVGIPDGQLEHIFERFWQAQHARRAGAGLGLAICKGIVEAHGGSIYVESEVGVGTTFYVVLPAIYTESSRNGNAHARIHD